MLLICGALVSILFSPFIFAAVMRMKAKAGENSQGGIASPVDRPPAGGFLRVAAVLLTYLLGPWLFGWFVFPTAYMMFHAPQLLVLFGAGVAFLLFSLTRKNDGAPRHDSFIRGMVLLSVHWLCLSAILTSREGIAMKWDQAIFAAFIFHATCLYQAGRIWWSRKFPTAPRDRSRESADGLTRVPFDGKTADRNTLQQSPE